MDLRNMKPLLQTPRLSLRGFAIKDLVVTLAVVLILVILAYVTINAAHERALRAQCRNNLMQIGAALKSFSQANNGLLPDCSRSNPQFWGGAWPWDVNTNVITELDQRGAPRNSLYCPANPAMNDISHWEFWRFTGSRIRVISYGLLLNGRGQVPPDFWRKDLLGAGAVPPAQTELAFDATVSMRGDFGHIIGTFTDRSNHMRRSLPTGGNVLFEDQHVDWRDFKQMQPRFTTMPDATWYF